MALTASGRTIHRTTVPPRNPYVALFDDEEDHNESSEEEVRPTSRSPKRKALSVSSRSLPELTRPRLPPTLYRHQRQRAVIVNGRHHHLQARSTPLSRTSSSHVDVSHLSLSTSSSSSTSYYSTATSSRSQEHLSPLSSPPLGIGETSTSTAERAMPPQPDSSLPVPRTNVHSALKLRASTTVAAATVAPVASRSEDFRASSSCAPRRTTEATVNGSPSSCASSSRKSSAFTSRRYSITSNSSSSSLSSSSGSEFDSESEREMNNKTKISGESSSVRTRRHRPRHHASSSLFMLRGQQHGSSHTLKQAHSPARSASGLTVTSNRSSSPANIRPCPPRSTEHQPHAPEPPIGIASSASMCEAWRRRFGALFSSSSSESESDDEEEDPSETEGIRRRTRGMCRSIGNERWRELTRAAPPRRPVTATRVAADAPYRHAHEQQRVPFVTSSAPASLPNTSPGAHTTPAVSAAIVIVAGGKGRAKQASADIDAAADLGVDAEDISISVTSATATLTPSSTSSSTSTTTLRLSSDDDPTTTAATSLSVPCLELASYYDVETDVEEANPMTAEEEIANALSASVFFTLPPLSSADVAAPPPALGGLPRARSSTITLGANTSSRHSSRSSTPASPSSPSSHTPATPALARSKSKRSPSTIIRTELDISLSPLFEHILALYEHEHAREEEEREAEEEAYRKSLLLVEERRYRPRPGRKQGERGWWSWLGSGSRERKAATTTSKGTDRQSQSLNRGVKSSSSIKTNSTRARVSRPPSSSGSRGESPWHTHHRHATDANKKLHSAPQQRHPRSVKGTKLRKHPINIAYGYRACPADVRKVFYSSQPQGDMSMPPNDRTPRSDAETGKAKWEWLFASATDILATPAHYSVSSTFDNSPGAREGAEEDDAIHFDEGEMEAEFGLDIEDMNVELDTYSSSAIPLPANLTGSARESSSRDRKTKRGAIYGGRSPSPLPRPPAWLHHRQEEAYSPTSPRSSSHLPAPSSIPSRPIRHPAPALTSRHSGGGSTSDEQIPYSPVLTRKRTYTDTRFFLVYALENSVRMRLLNTPGEEGDELRASSGLGWDGSRAFTMVRKERNALRGAGRGVGVSSRLSVVGGICD